jgi:hypothetical protein
MICVKLQHGITRAPSPLFSTLTPLFRNEGVVPDVQVQIEMKQKGKKQRQVKKNDIRQEKEVEFFSGNRLEKAFHTRLSQIPVLQTMRLPDLGRNDQRAPFQIYPLIKAQKSPRYS